MVDNIENSQTDTNSDSLDSTLIRAAKTSTSPATTFKPIDFSALTKPTAADLKTKKGGGGGKKDVQSFSIVNNVNGHRISFSDRLYQDIGSPKSFQIAVDDSHLYIGKFFPDGGDEKFKVKTSRICYHRGLVEYLTNEFGLNYSNVTSISFRDVDILTEEHNGKELKIAKIDMTTGTTAGYEYDDSDEDEV